MNDEQERSDAIARDKNHEGLESPLPLVDVAKLFEPGSHTVQQVLEISRALAIHRWRYAT